LLNREFAKEGARMMKQTAFKEQEQQLRAKMAELLAQHRDSSALKIESAADPFDQIQASVERDLLVGLLNHDARLHEDLRRAFELIESGEYGRCEDCEGAIAPARLKAIPWARRCVRCQEERDQAVNEPETYREAA
jgi:DnaK suppressor protein